ncbi:MAG TPA: 16S rRNA processing protein RimM [Syntrophothermus lipocalidus]|uniref:Ribosome maturation factor RimM n=1 Tax=Syntrophothermus lipocalidus (strain DSM 12680 / TGB-C1) TaxID=643648 RepID=D7CLV4_SYNLT|nr:ribosome maturation factor RimM [Syntrophothermus lipocalidus]ADI01689.1 16S rRNA processing protein RimM [Syntrophothermus lipocalidus DSM 12680]HHV77086.1 16S rRNA processing protein RimM [Syntrophothermus lipocalidus]
MTKDLITVGEVCGTFGTEGKLKVRPLTDFPERFNGMKEVLVQQGDNVEVLTIEAVSPLRDFMVFKFRGIDTREQARCLVRAYLKVPPSEVFPLPEDCYYIFQLKGLEVYDDTRGFLGTITDVIQTGANDVYVVQGGPFGEVLIPAIKQVVRDIRLEEGRVEVRLIPGLIDEGDEDSAD